MTGIRAPTPDIANHQVVLTQLKEVAETGMGIRGDPLAAYLTVAQLVNAGIIKYISGVVSPATPKAGAGGTVSVADSITGTGASGAPLQLAGDSASPGNSMVYGTDGSGTKGWQTPGGGGSYTPPVNTKGDLFGYSTVPARVPVGTDGDVLTADSSAARGVSWQTPSGGGGSSATFMNGNVTVDSHPASPSARDDEFEATTLDAKWTWLNQNTATATFNGSGAIKITSSTQTAAEVNAITQSLLAVTAWDYRAKVSQTIPTSFNNGGIILLESATGKIVRLTIFDNGGNPNYDITTFSNATTQVGSLASGAIALPLSLGTTIGWYYQRVQLVSGTYVWQVSFTGEEESFVTVYSFAPTAWFTSAADTIGLYVSGQNSGTPSIMRVDWFRDYTSGYAPATGYALPAYNITPDTHPAGVQPFIANDEFESGTVLDTTGTRFAGATPWTIHNSSVGTGTMVKTGVLAFLPVSSAVNVNMAFTQPVVVPTAAWSYVTKQLSAAGDGSANATFAGMFVGIGSTGQGYNFGRYCQNGNNYVNYNPTYAGGSTSNPWSGSIGGGFAGSAFTQPIYYRISYDGSANIAFAYSYDGIFFNTVVTISIATDLGGVPADSVGLFCGGQTGSAPSPAMYDYLRRIS